MNVDSNVFRYRVGAGNQGFEHNRIRNDRGDQRSDSRKGRNDFANTGSNRSDGERSITARVDTEDGERSRTARGETEGSESLAREKSTKGEQLWGKRKRSDGSAASTNIHERQHHSKRKPSKRKNWRKHKAPSSLEQAIEIKRQPQGSYKWRKRQVQQSLPLGSGTRKMTRREAVYERQVLFGRSSPCPSRGTETNDKSCPVPVHLA
ncbi:hypothetical protein TNIN_157481 [Trichonephila inaurata madagascariensis]|uniref:Uncharacterized protein n=1 Tax=Trichonephila inaurata madagascariensis TaxID=2747483 RepID=A0A8X6XYX0_9ARAC|nr:hypothetical protein TNIN_157481 [Trichonephila inaurata madagascariensis]